MNHEIHDGPGHHEHPPHHKYHADIGTANLDFTKVSFGHSEQTGRQILDAVKAEPVDAYLLYKLPPSGDPAPVRPDEVVHLHEHPLTRLLVFKSDRAFFFELNGIRREWGQATILGAVLKKLAGVDLETHQVWQVVPGQEKAEKLIENHELADLAQPGIEHFFVKEKPEEGYVIGVNSRDEAVPTKHVTFEQVVKLAYPGAPVDPKVRYSMTYRNAASKPHAGELAEGGSVEVKHEGTIFNVAKTVQS